MRDEVASSLQSSSRDVYRLVAVVPWNTARFRVEKQYPRRGQDEHPCSRAHGHGHDPSRNSFSMHLDQDFCDAGPT